MAKTKRSSRRTDAGTPKQRTCGAMQQHFYLLETFPSFRRNLLALEHRTVARLRTAEAARVTPYKITVVVHVVHNPAAPAEKISPAQVKSQICSGHEGSIRRYDDRHHLHRNRSDILFRSR